MPFIIDNSIVSGWLLASQATQATDYTQRIAARLLDDTALAPALLRLEYGNVLRTACKRGKLSAQEAQQAIAALGLLPIRIDSTPPKTGALLALSLRLDLTLHGASYLDLALREQLPIATQDAALADAARSAGVGVLGESRAGYKACLPWTPHAPMAPQAR